MLAFVEPILTNGVLQVFALRENPLVRLDVSDNNHGKILLQVQSRERSNRLLNADDFGVPEKGNP